MTKLILPALIFFLAACTIKPKDPAIVATTDSVSTITEPEKIFDYPVVYKNWEMGNHENTRLVLQMYSAWDGKTITGVRELLADSFIMELPGSVRRAAGKEVMIDKLVSYRQNYLSTKHDIIAIQPLLNQDNKEEWVIALVYNKWTYRNQARDSMLYQDIWKLKNGKINSLMSLELSPSRLGYKRLEQITKTAN